MSIIEGVVVGAETGGFYTTEIEQSLRFNDDDSAYLSWTPASAGNRKTWTFSAWVKRGNLGTNQVIFGAGITSGSTDLVRLWFQTDDTLRVYCDTGSANWRATTSAVYRDVGAWYHVTLRFDSTDATDANRIKLYVNGEQVATTPFNDGFGDYMPQNSEFGVNNTRTHTVGRCILSGYYTDAYLAETHFIDGTAYDATAFGEFKNGVWVPKTPSVTYGTNGFYLDYSNGASIGADSSGNGNNWTPTNLASTDVMLDSPTNNFATWNPLANALGAAVSEGNLKLIPPSATDKHIFSTLGIDSGKWYFEVMASSSTAARGAILISDADHNTTGVGNNWINVAFHSGAVTTSATDNGDTSIVSVNKILTCCFDADSGQAWFAVDSAPNTGGTAQVTGMPTSETYRISYRETGSPTMATVTNFGQDSSFAGNKTPQGNTDANGRGDFYYAPPTGYLALCTANLPEPAIGPNSATTSDEHFNTVLWTGDNNQPRSITGVGFQPDFVWTKVRNSTYSNTLFDVVRSSDAALFTDTTGVEQEPYNHGILNSFDSDGFTVDSGPSSNLVVNESGKTYVAWNWKADNTSGSTNTDGTITSTVAANVDAGFSIVSYTGNGTALATVGHGLNSDLDMVIIKNRDSAQPWVVFTEMIDGSYDYLYLNQTTAAASYISDGFNSGIFTLSAGADNNVSGGNYIAYCFHSVEGYSKFGSYTGNGSTDGPFVYCGFRPAFVMTKRIDTTSHWFMYDDARSISNATDDIILANGSDAEYVNNVSKIDILSNGFKLRNTEGMSNLSGGTYIFMCFAENPFKYSNAR